MEHQKTIFDLLASSFLFRGLPTDSLTLLAHKTKLLSLHKGDILIEEEVLNDKIYLILEGLVKIYKITPDGKEVFLAIEKSGDYLGVMDLSDKPASATIESLKSTTVLTFPKKELSLILEKNPNLWQNMYRIILAKVEEYRKLQTITLSNNLQERTYHFLQFLSPFFKNNSIVLSHDQIALIVGATRPRVTEALHTLQNLQKIKMFPKKIVLLI